MKKLFNILFASMLVCLIVLFHVSIINAQENTPSQDVASSREEVAPLQEGAPSQEGNSLQQTASLQEVTSPEVTPVKIVRAVICRDVMDREPVEVGDSFDAYVGKLYCFTKIVGAKTPVEVTHAWYHGDTEMARVALPVRSTSWRTYSSKIIMADTVGDWHVDVIGPEGEVLQTVEFKISPQD